MSEKIMFYRYLYIKGHQIKDFLGQNIKSIIENVTFMPLRRLHCTSMNLSALTTLRIKEFLRLLFFIICIVIDKECNEYSSAHSPLVKKGKVCLGI